MAGKGSPAAGRHNKSDTHIRCRRCGKKSYHIHAHRCASCGFGAQATIRKYPGWQRRVHASNGYKKFQK